MKPVIRVLLFCLSLYSFPARAVQPVIEIQGVSEELLENLQASLSLSEETCEAPRWRIKRLFNRSTTALKQGARALGYYHVKIDQQLSFENNCWQASFTIEPGQPVLLQAVTIHIEGEAQHDKEFEKLLEATPVRVGNQLHHGQYEKLKDQIETLAADRGYFDGRFKQKFLKVEPEKYKASVLLDFDSGERYRIGSLELQQNTYNPELLDRYLNIKSGDFYNSTSLVTLHRALADSGYFQQVIIKQDFKNAADGNIDVQVQLEPRKRTAYSIGIGAATDTGPRLKASIEKRRINRRGHRFVSELMLSEIDSTIGFEYIIPTQWANIEQVSLRAGYEELNTDTSDSTIHKIGVRTIGKRNDWVESIFLDWVSEDSDIGSETVSSDLLVPGISWSKTVADNRWRTRKGHRLNLEFRGAEESLLSDSSFAQLLASAKWIQPLGNGRLLLRAQTGLSLTDDFSELPASYRFFAGGDQSIRGYEYQSLGPLDNNGDVNGGKYLFTSTIEYEHPIVGNWSAAFFMDAGNAFDKWDADLKNSVGTGLRWQSPIGPIRLDIAVPDDTSRDDYRLHFSMGPDL